VIFSKGPKLFSYFVSHTWVGKALPAPDFHSVPSFPTLKNTSLTVVSKPDLSTSLKGHPVEDAASVYGYAGTP